MMLLLAVAVICALVLAIVAEQRGDDGSANVDMDAVEDVTDFTEICAGEVTRVIIQMKRASTPDDS